MAKPLTVEAPPVNIYESSGQLTIAIPMPGAHNDTVEVVLEGRTLRAQAEARYPQEQQHYLQHEWSVGRFQREIELPKPVQAAGAKAMLTHGVLTVSLPLAGPPAHAGGAGRATPAFEASHQRSSASVRIPVGEPPSHQASQH